MDQPVPLVKVIVPCYRYGHLLEGCLGSVLGQEGVEARVLIVDDCSPDRSAEVAAAIAAREPRVEACRNERNLGIVATANRGLEWAADSDYVVVLSADDLLTPGSLRRAVAAMEANPAVGMVYGRVADFESNEALPDPGERWRGARVWPGERWLRWRCRSGRNCIASPEVVVRTAVQRRVGPYDARFPHTTDFNMWLRIAAVSDVAYVRGVAQAHYRVHADSMFRTMLYGEGGFLTDLEERRAAFESLFEGAGSGLRRASSLRALARRTLAREALWQANRAYDRDQLEQVPVEALVRFAAASAPDVWRLREWWELRLRRRLGAGRGLWFPPLLVSGAAQRARSGAERLRTRWWGV